MEMFSLYNFVWYFVIYAFLGWTMEVAYAATKTGTFINRGFLNGPYCPVYGLGAILIISVLAPIGNNIFLLFLGGLILTSSLEWITGFALEKIFNDKWWDYSNRKFNLNGYICLKFSVIWGVVSVVLVDFIHPVVSIFVRWFPDSIGKIFVFLLVIILISDTFVTANSILKLNKKLKLMNEIANKLKETSNMLGENIFEEVIDLEKKEEKAKEIYEEFKEKGLKEVKIKRTELEFRYDELKLKYDSLLDSKDIIHDRLVTAFPGIKSPDFGSELEALKCRIKKGKDCKKTNE